MQQINLDQYFNKNTKNDLTPYFNTPIIDNEPEPEINQFEMDEILNDPFTLEELKKKEKRKEYMRKYQSLYYQEIKANDVEAFEKRKTVSRECYHKKKLLENPDKVFIKQKKRNIKVPKNTLV